MPQNYDVDDILEEIRRKRQTQGRAEQPESRTYSAGNDQPRAERARSAQPRAERARSEQLRDTPAPRSSRSRQSAGSASAGDRLEQRRPAAFQQQEDAPPAHKRRSPAQQPPSVGRGGRPARATKEKETEEPLGFTFAEPSERDSRRAAADELYEEVRRAPVKRQEGFQFQAPGVAGQQDEFGLPLDADEQDTGGSDTSDFSMHFDLDDSTAERPLLNDNVPVDYTLEMQRPRRTASSRKEGRREERRNERKAQRLQEPHEPDESQDENLVQSRWQQSFMEQETLEQESPQEDYASPQDAPFVARELQSARTGLMVRMGISGALTLALLYLALSLKELPFAKLLGLADGYLLPLPVFLLDGNEIQMRLFLIVNLVLFVLCALACSNVVGAGIAAVCRLRATSDSPAALAVLAVLIQGIVLVVFPNAVLGLAQVSVYFPVASATLLFTLIGKLMLVNRVRRNFLFTASEKEKNAYLQIQNRDFSREFSRGLGPDVDRVAYSAKTDFLLGFLDKSYTGDYSDTFSCVAAPVSFAGALLVGIVTGVLSKDAIIAVSAFAAVMCVCAPFSAAIVPNLMLGQMAKWLTKRGAMIAGYETAEDCADTGAIILQDKDLFSEESVQLHGMKVFAEKRIDEAILDAASVILSCRGILSGVFLNMINGNTQMLKKVDGLIYEDGMGISAWVGGKRVLIGSHELMRNHEIECPSKDYEARYVRSGRKVLYIANSGELSAMFVLSYNGEPRIAERLGDLSRRGVALILQTTDPNVTAELMSSAFSIKKNSVRILPAKLHPEHAYLTRPKERISAGAAHGGGLLGVLQLLRASACICRSVRAGALVQLIGIIVGYGLIAFMAVTNSLALATYLTLIGFLAACLLVTTLASVIGKS